MPPPRTSWRLSWASLAAPVVEPAEHQATQPCRQHDLEALAADLDGDPLPLTGFVRVPSVASVAGIGLDLVVELGLDPGRVHPEGRTPSPMKAGSSTTAAWNGITVGMPSTTNSESARRDRSSAWVRSRPETISLAIRESNEPGTVSPVW